MNINNIDFKKRMDFIKKYFDKDAALYAIVLLLILFFGIKQFLIADVSKLGTNFTTFSQKKQELDQYIERDKVAQQVKPKNFEQKLPINIYVSPYPGMDIESASVEFVEEIIQIIKKTGNQRINQVDFSTLDLTDNSGTSSDSYGILRLNLAIEGTYKSIRDLLNEIYLMKYLVRIKSVEILPLQGSNNETTEGKLTLDLYIKKT